VYRVPEQYFGTEAISTADRRREAAIILSNAAVSSLAVTLHGAAVVEQYLYQEGPSHTIHQE